MSEHRPDPDALLARVQEEEARASARQAEDLLRRRGRASARRTRCWRRRASSAPTGWTCVVGVVETHGRAETEALLEGLEILPPPRASSTAAPRSTSSTSTRRWPAPAPPPGRRAGPHQRAGLAPRQALAGRRGAARRRASTSTPPLNVQHLESLNDVVAQITGVVVRETVPDSVFEQADEVELVDLPPDDLLAAPARGQGLRPRAGRSRRVENFFRKGNLIALRELALRRTAERVDAQMRGYRREHAHRRGRGRRPSGSWSASARARSRARLVRAARRMAARCRREWIARLRRDAGPAAAAAEADATASSRRCGWPSSSAPRRSR